MIDEAGKACTRFDGGFCGFCHVDLGDGRLEFLHVVLIRCDFKLVVVGDAVHALDLGGFIDGEAAACGLVVHEGEGVAFFEFFRIAAAIKFDGRVGKALIGADVFQVEQRVCRAVGRGIFEVEVEVLDALEVADFGRFRAVADLERVARAACRRAARDGACDRCVFEVDDVVVRRRAAAADDVARDGDAAVQIDLVALGGAPPRRSNRAAVYIAGDRCAGQVYFILVCRFGAVTAENIAGYCDFADVYDVFDGTFMTGTATFDKARHISLNVYDVSGSLAYRCVAAVDLYITACQNRRLRDRKLVFRAVASPADVSRKASRPAAVDILVYAGNAVIQRYDILLRRVGHEGAAAPGARGAVTVRALRKGGLALELVAFVGDVRDFAARPDGFDVVLALTVCAQFGLYAVRGIAARKRNALLVPEQRNVLRGACGIELVPIDRSLVRACDLEHRLPFGYAVRFEGHFLEIFHFLRFVVFAFDEELVSRGDVFGVAAV